MKRMLSMHEVRRGRMKSKALPCMKFMLLLQHERLASLHAARPRFINFALKTAVTVQRKAQ